MAPKRKCVLKNCSIPILRNSASLHQFPKNEVDRKNWQDFLSISKWNKTKRKKLPKFPFLCSIHFQSCCFYSYGKYRTIKQGHFPSVAVDEEGICHELQECNENPEMGMDIDEVASHCAEPQLFVSEHSNDLLNKKLIAAELLIEGYSKQITSKNRIIKQQKNRIAYLEMKLEKNKYKSRKTTIQKKYKSRHTQTGTINITAGDGKYGRIFETIIDRRSKPKNISYEHSFREFAVAMHYYSPKAYNYLRSVSEYTLPNPRTLSIWTSGITTSPGFLPDSLKYISSKNTDPDNPIYYSLSLDEVSIRKQVIFDGKQMTGYVDYGNFNVSKPSIKEAANALFVMCTEINGTEKTPIAYILTNGCDNDLVSAVIDQSLKEIHKCGGKALTVTFDGLPSNFLAIETLGGSTDVLDPAYKPFIQHPTDPDSTVYFTPDPCHMMKLLRNALQSSGFLIDMHGQEIKWEYFEKLDTLQKMEGLKAANRISSRHVHFGTQKMKVKIAVQLLSSSSAVALKFCEKIGLDEFQGASATAKFAEIVDRLFDVLNSRTTGTGFKAPLSNWNRNIWTKFFADARLYLLGLTRVTISKKTQKRKSRQLLKTKLGTCIKGLVMCIDSLSKLMEDLVLPGLTTLRYFPTYKICQDHVELFFSSLRQRFGNNNNPNVLQLKAAIRSMLAVRISPNPHANCTSQDESTTSQVSPMCNTSQHNREENTNTEDLPDLPSFSTLSTYVNNVVTYIAGFVGRAVLKQVYCEPCVSSLVHADPEYTKIRSDYVLLNEKDNGGLFIPSEDLVAVCKETERVIRELELKGVRNLKSASILKSSLGRILKTTIFSELRYTLSVDHTSMGTHVFDLISTIVAQYTKVRLHHIAREKTIRLSPVCIRNKLNKVILFQGQ